MPGGIGLFAGAARPFSSTRIASFWSYAMLIARRNAIFTGV
jgi:hypothetical protein